MSSGFGLTSVLILMVVHICCVHVSMVTDFVVCGWVLQDTPHGSGVSLQKDLTSLSMITGGGALTVTEQWGVVSSGCRCARLFQFKVFIKMCKNVPL